MKIVLQYLYNNRLEFFLGTLLFNLFGILIFTDSFFLEYLFPIALLLNTVAGINLLVNKRLKIILTVLFFASALTSGYAMWDTQNLEVDIARFGFFFLFYAIITFEIIKQVWAINEVTKNLILGVVSGYMSLGLVGYFIVMAVEMLLPGSFSGNFFEANMPMNEKSDSLLYFSYITLMTIGYGEIVPVTTAAQKASMLLGLMGQFYMVIITAVVVGKYINFSKK